MAAGTFLYKTGLKYSGNYLRRAFGLCSYFRKPDQGVMEYEVLSRASMHVIKWNKPHKKKYHLVSTAHVTHPWKFTKFYPENDTRFAWLQFLEECDTKNMLQLRQENTGKLLKEFKLCDRTFRYEERDLAVLHLEDEEHFEEVLKFHNIKFEPIEFHPYVAEEGQKVIMIGNDFTTTSDGEEILVPVSLEGTVNLVTEESVFISTPMPSTMGMCGGPVLLQRGLDSAGQSIGMVEALVNQMDKQRLQREPNFELVETLKRIEGNTMVLPDSDIGFFLKGVEEHFEADEFEPIQLFDIDKTKYSSWS